VGKVQVVRDDAQSELPVDADPLPADLRLVAVVPGEVTVAAQEATGDAETPVSPVADVEHGLCTGK